MVPMTARNKMEPEHAQTAATPDATAVQTVALTKPDTTVQPSRFFAENDIQLNSLYFAYNKPVTDDYHRSIFITYPPTCDGTLFHAAYNGQTWNFERREINNLAKSKGLVLLWRFGVLTGPTEQRQEQFNLISDVLSQIDRRSDEDFELCTHGSCYEKFGHPAMQGYSCVVWIHNAIAELERRGLICLWGKSVEDFVASARKVVGPEDPKIMVGREFGGLRTFN